MTTIRIGFCCLLALMLVACSQKQEQQSQPQPPAQPAAEQQPPSQASPAAGESTEASPARTQTRPAERSTSARGKMNPRSGAAEQAPRTASSEGRPGAAGAPQTSATPPPLAPRAVVIPAGTRLSVRLVDPLDSAINKTGDTFQATLDNDVVVDGVVVAPRGATVTGRLTEVQQSGRVKGLAEMSVALKDLHIGEATYPIQTNVLSFQAESTKNKDAAKVGIGAGIGAAIGAIAGGGKGAAIGAAVGGGAGGATVLASRGKELKFPAEHQFAFNLRSDVRVALR